MPQATSAGASCSSLAAPFSTYRELAVRNPLALRLSLARTLNNPDLFYGGTNRLRKVDGWQTLAEQPPSQCIDLAA